MNLCCSTFIIFNVSRMFLFLVGFAAWSPGTPPFVSVGVFFFGLQAPLCLVIVIEKGNAAPRIVLLEPEISLRLQARLRVVNEW